MLYNREHKGQSNNHHRSRIDQGAQYDVHKTEENYNYNFRAG